MLHELGREGPDPLAAERDVEDRVGPPSHVDDGGRQRLVHRHRRVAETGDPGPVTERLGQRAAQDEGDVSTVVHVDSRSPAARIARSKRPWWANDPRRWS
jgi:hypothetical protein